MNFKSFIISIFVLVSFSVSASKMVFLVEDANGKHVGLSKNNKDYTLLDSDMKWNLYPSISSDGQRVTFVKGSDQDTLVLTVKNLNDGIDSTYTQESFILQPKFAKQDSMIFFSMNSKIGYVKTEDKSQEITFINEDLPSYFPIPFQSGEVIIYQRNGTEKEIVLFDILNNEKIVIGKGMSPSLSKDEKFIAYTSKQNENWDIHIYDRFTKKTIKVTSHQDRDFSPSFDARGNLLYTSDRLENGVFSIFTQSYESWSEVLNQETLLISKPGTSFYAPQISGNIEIQIEQLPKLTGEPRSSFGTIELNGKVYVAGGHQGAEHTYPPESFTGRMTAFDLKTKKWSDMAPRINPSHGFQLAAYKHYIYAFGGFAYEETTSPKWKSLAVVERYNTLTNKWEEISTMPRRRSSNTVSKIGNKIYLIGGWDSTPKFKDDVDGTFHDEIDVYDLEKNSWKTLETKLPLKRRAFNSFIRDGKIHLVGGISEGGSHFALLDNFTVFNPKTSQFSELPKLPFATFAPASGTIADKAFVFGGMFKLSQWEYEYIPHIYEYDFNEQRWEHSGRYLKEYKGFSQVVNLGQCLGILGGHSYQGNEDRPVDTFEKICLK